MMPDQARAASLAKLQVLAMGIRETTEHERASRLLERVSQDPAAERLRAALVELGARAVLAGGTR